MNRYFTLPFRWLAWWSRPGSRTRKIICVVMFVCILMTIHFKGVIEWTACVVGCALAFIYNASEHPEVSPDKWVWDGPYFKV